MQALAVTFNAEQHDQHFCKVHRVLIYNDRFVNIHTKTHTPLSPPPVAGPPGVQAIAEQCYGHSTEYALQDERLQPRLREQCDIGNKKRFEPLKPS
eukprot:scaffold241879_cov24-Tisochrysis_lutea.AAC.1